MRGVFQVIAIVGLAIGLLTFASASRSFIGAENAPSGPSLRAWHDHGGASRSSIAASDLDDDDTDDLADVSNVPPLRPLHASAGWAQPPPFSHDPHAIEPATPPPRG